MAAGRHRGTAGEPGGVMNSYIEDMRVYDMVVQERRHAADLFESLTAGQLATPSLCDAWTMTRWPGTWPRICVSDS